MIKLFNQYLENSSVHGLKRIKTSKNIWVKTFWTVTVLFFLLSSYWIVTLIWNRFADNPLRITRPSAFEPVSTVPFPAITICSPNNMRKSNVDRFLKGLTYLPDGMTIEGFRKLLPQLNSINFIATPVNMSDLMILNKVLKANRYTIEETMKFLMNPCTDFIYECRWEGQNVKCDEFFKLTYGVDGFCCTFNSKFGEDADGKIVLNRRTTYIPKYTNYFGPDMGLSIKMNPYVNDTEDVSRHGYSQIIAHGNNDFPLEKGRFAYAKHGRETFIPLKPMQTYVETNVANLHFKDRKCVLDGEKSLRTLYPYTKTNCEVETFVNKTLHRCNCTKHQFPRHIEDRICNIVEATCISFKIQQLMAETIKSYECPKLCFDVKYELDFYYGKFEHHGATVNSFYNDSELSKNITIVHIYFHKQFFCKDRLELITSWTSLLSNLGGAFGLGVGCSIISILEVLYYAIKMLYVFLSKFIKKNNDRGHFIEYTN